MHLRVGYVTARPDGRLHLAVLGFAHCGAGTGRIRGQARDLVTADAPAVCRRCVHRIRALLLDAIAETMRRRDSGAKARLSTLNSTVDALRTTAQAAAETALAAGVAHRIRAGRPVHALSGLGALRAAHAAAAAAERRPRQLALFA